MAKQAFHTPWATVKKHFKKPGNKAASPMPQEEETLTDKNSMIKKSAADFDWVLYCGLNPDLAEHGITDEKKASLHYERHGKQEGRIASLAVWLKAYGFEKSCFPPGFSLELFSKLNDVKLLEAADVLKNFFEAEKPAIITVSIEQSVNSRFFLELGKHYDVANKPDRAYVCYMYSNYFQANGDSLEHLGNILFGRKHYKGAVNLYTAALRTDKDRKWCYKNLTDSYVHLGNYEAGAAAVLEGLKRFADFKPLEDAFKNVIDKYWQERESGVTALCMSGERDALLAEAKDIVDFISSIYRRRALLFSESLRVSLNPRRVLIIGDFALPQCRRYRIYQKLEQLAAAGFEVTAMPWGDWQLNSVDPELCYSAVFNKDKMKVLQHKLQHEDAIAWHDIIIFYRVPAFPHIIEAIVQARALGKLTFYEIDDLLFDPIYPPPLESYGGYVVADDYIGLLRGMTFYRAAAQLCQYGIASTNPLAEKLGELVESGHCYLHRNGLDSDTPRQSPRMREGKEYIDIFYGSGTHAHNADFIAEVLPALDKILAAHANVRLLIVGYLQLPRMFLQKYPEQVIIKPFVELAKYWNYLASADINIAVLLEDGVNHCKSELKWFEAACFGIPTVVSRTRNYSDVIHPGEDGFIVSGADEWLAALNKLVNSAELRLRMGEVAMSRVNEEYSIQALANNIRQILESAIDDYSKTNTLQISALENKEDMSGVPTLIGDQCLEEVEEEEVYDGR